MMPDFLLTSLKVLMVIIILIGMIIILMGINHLTHNDDSISPNETKALKREVRDDQRVISRRSVFHKFLARDLKRGVTKQS